MNNLKNLTQVASTTKPSSTINENASGEAEADKPKYCSKTIDEKLDLRNEFKRVLYESVAHESQVIFDMADAPVIETELSREELAKKDTILMDIMEPDLQQEQEIPTALANQDPGTKELAALHPLIDQAASPPTPPEFKRDKGGEILVTMDNIVKAIRSPDICGMTVAYDIFRDEIVAIHYGDTNWVPFKESDYSRIRINLERNSFKPPNKEIVREATLLCAEINRIDTAEIWLNSLEWDRVHRVDSFMPMHIGTADTPYHRAVGRYLWTALAGRVLSPGCKADMVPVLMGRQGTRKSSAVAALSPELSFYTEISFTEKDDDLSRKMRGCLVAEIAELKGINSREAEHVKAWITKQNENWIPKYKEFSTTFPRRLVFVGTTNREEFLSDETGNRRWLPVRVENVIDVDRVIKDRAQLWAEARELFKDGGIDYKEAEELAIEVHSDHIISDSWLPIVADWLKSKDNLDPELPYKRSYLQTHEVLLGAIGMSARDIDRKDEMRIGKVLKSLGYVRKKKRLDGCSGWIYFLAT